MIFIFLGPPGSGKGTQAEIIAQQHNIRSLSTGEVLRSKAAEDTDSGRELKLIMESGKLVSTELVNNIIVEALQGAKSQSLILDGYPRNRDQAEFLASKVEGLVIIFFDVKDELLVKRLSGRFSCKSCNKIYNKYFSSPKIENICDECSGSEFVYRSDDNIEVISRRLTEYRKETFELIEYYRTQGMLNTIDASLSVQNISSQVEKIVKNSLT